MRRLLLAGAVLCVVAASPSYLRAGLLHPALRARLAAVPPHATVEAILYLQAQAPVEIVKDAAKARALPRAETHREVVSLLRSTAAETQANLLETLERMTASGAVVDVRRYWIANAVRIRATPAALEQLAARGDVAVIEPAPELSIIEPVRSVERTQAGNGSRASSGSAAGEGGSAAAGAVSPSDGSRPAAAGDGVTPGIRAIRADRVWYDLGVTGEGTVVACLDTGVEAMHPALRERWRGFAADPSHCWFGSGDSQFPVDYHGHGTSVMGTITGLAGPDTIGVAWGAQWIAANGIAPNGDAIGSFEFFADPDGDPTTIDDVPDVVQNSWGTLPAPGEWTWCDSYFWTVMDACEAAGVVLVFSAGNEGPSARTIRSPADRAASPTNAFSVGAIDGTYSEWPYPLALFSSLGPSRCPGEAIKPEVVAPGLDVYTSAVGSAYRIVSGTSLSGPHVAGVVALIRQVRPDLDSDGVKQILMDTARNPNGGEDNSYGRGVVDAYAAVLAAAGDQGRIHGRVSFAGDATRGIGEAEVRLAGTDIRLTTWETGGYGGFVPSGVYDLVCAHPLLETRTVPGVRIDRGSVLRLDLALADRTGPAVEAVDLVPATDAPSDSTRLGLRLRDYGPIAAAELHHRIGTEAWRSRPMEIAEDGAASAWLPAGRFGEPVEFWIEAVDLEGNTTVDPAGAPAEPRQFRLRRAVLVDDAEIDRGWTADHALDSGVGGWERMAPFGSRDPSSGRLYEPDRDHTAGSGTFCFVTGRGKDNVEPDRADVDGGCVTLLSPILRAAGMDDLFLSYWRWFALAGDPDGSLEVAASRDGGATWVALERVTADAAAWTRVSWHLGGALGSPLGAADSVQLRFTACDEGEDSIVEAAIDDIVLYGTPPPPPLPPPAPAVTRIAASPNPFRESAGIRFQAEAGGDFEAIVYDTAGREIRRLEALGVPSGPAQLDWDGRDASGRKAPAGLYLYRLRGPGIDAEGKIIRIE